MSTHVLTLPLAPPRVLVVDDDPIGRTILAAQVEANGGVPVIASSGEEAVDLHAAGGIDIVLMDVMMPGIGGLEATRRIKARQGTGWTPVVLVSIASEDESVVKGIGAGADDYFYKPIRPLLFGAKLRSLVRTLQLRQQVERATDALRASVERLRIGALVFDATRDSVMITDAAMTVLDVNPAFSEVSGFSREEALGRTPRMLASGRTPRETYADMWASLRARGFWRGEVINRRKDGQVAPETLSIAAVQDEATGTVTHFVGVVSRVNTLRDDIVTGLPGRQMLRERLLGLTEHARATGRTAACVVLGLDGFTEVNAALGFVVGDQLLREVAERLRNCLRRDGEVFRLGGDEFGILMPAAEPDNVAAQADMLLQALAVPYWLGKEMVHITARAGAAFCPDDASDGEALLEHAQEALRIAKVQPGHRVEYFTRSRRDEALARKRLLDDLRTAAAQGQLTLNYQPIIDLRTGRLCKAEALLRWRHPARGAVSPAEFIPLAEHSGLVAQLGRWCFREAFAALPRMRGMSPTFQLSLNLSPRQLRDSDFDPDAVLAGLAEAGVPADALLLEFTEGVLLEADDRVRACLHAFRSAGVGLAIDDFGVGYSSLSYLDRFELDVLKIDQSFVRRGEGDSRQKALCEAIISMGHHLGLAVVAEGIETAAQQRFLEDAGCDFGQGYLLGRPMPLEDLLGALERQGSPFPVEAGPR